ncbi:MAG TPA: hypothetical protein VFN61_06790 [Acidimicrobiales bacterium]|nr:hypothetical protein [Acidimicrobiales bacterium]
MNRKQVPLRLCALIGAVTMMWCGGATSQARAADVTRPESTWASLRVVHCKTVTPWVPSPKPKASPRSEHVRVPYRFADKLVVYEDSLGVMLVSPIGWQCSAAYGEDGSGDLRVIAPRGASSQDRDGQLNAIWQGACVGCTESLACPFFPAAAALYRQDQGRNCPVRKPKGEVVRTLGLHLVAFMDPAGAHGDGVPSGGAYPDHGIITFYPTSSQGPQSRMSNCYVPANDDSLCNVVLDQFIAWDGGAGPPPDR